MKNALPIIFFCGLCHCSYACPDTKKPDPFGQLDFFLGNNTSKAAILALVNQLDADSYSERQAAFEKLSHLPSLPGFVRQMSQQESRPEVKSRLIKLNKLSPIEEENEELNRILGQIHALKRKGALPKIIAIYQTGIWKPDIRKLHQAARSTIQLNDLPLVREKLNSESIPLRRLVAAALCGLPLKHSLPDLMKLLNDSSEKVRLDAAYSLARHKHKSSLTTFADLLDSNDFYTRYQSWSALKSISGKSYGYDPRNNATQRKPAITKWKQWVSGKEANFLGGIPDQSELKLFNGMDLTGWDVYENGRPVAEKILNWRVVDGELRCLGGNKGDIRTKQRFDNYILKLEFKCRAGDGDGGIGVMLTKENEEVGPGARGDGGRYLEVQLLPGNVGDLYSIEGFKALVNGRAMQFSAPRLAQVPDPFGKWHQLTLTVTNGSLQVEVNGVLVNEATGGPIGPGKIVIRNEGSAISYRNIILSQISE